MYIFYKFLALFNFLAVVGLYNHYFSVQLLIFWQFQEQIFEINAMV